MRRVICLALLAPLAACGGRKDSATISVTCSNGVGLVGAVSIDVLGDPTDGHPTLKFPDPANSGKTGTITVQPHQHCTIGPTSRVD